MLICASLEPSFCYILFIAINTFIQRSFLKYNSFFFLFLIFSGSSMKEDSGASSAWATETQLLGSTGPLIIQRKLMQWSCEIYSAVEPQGETTLKAMHGRHWSHLVLSEASVLPLDLLWNHFWLCLLHCTLIYLWQWVLFFLLNNESIKTSPRRNVGNEYLYEVTTFF